ncbi:acyl--CoA ligase [Catenulispora sp. NF23]|uniref:Acyl--CoA ligase n=1 Tax=Catenulispora pinistramenti TaxID=2705254 RepID=A0ABS5L5T0_9ACTN|nr:class I adenylate-forming enzyme family protein [Catenulispora pinistramenti]MBS2538288.1 acyl--CoA ligase [Catenulispora pinistramenti]MBS2553703.1 acyl--CoA ligase [Catenulispora pinistramenti]
MAAGIDIPTDPEWVDEVLLAGPDNQVCLVLGEPVDRAGLRRMVAARQQALTAAGLRAGGSVALCLPPSTAFITNLLAAWRIGARAALLDHRLTAFEVEQAIARLAPQYVVRAEHTSGGALRAFHEVQEKIVANPGGQPSETSHALVQLSSGSTGPSKAIGRTASDLIAEIDRYTAIGEGVPRGGERIVSLASMVHVLGLVGGLLYGLHAGARLVLPGRMTAEAILAAVAAGPEPTTLLGVPFHIELLAAVAEPPRLPQLTGMTTGGELVRAQVHDAFVDRYGIRLGNMYGMTELGVIATDLFGAHRPAILPAPGIQMRDDDGELHIAMENSPYVGLVDPARWSDGWLHTKDAGSVEPGTGLVRVRGRRDSQVSIGGLKVDLSEVEHTLAGLPGVEGAVVVYGKAIEAYVVLTPAASLDDVQAGLTERVAPYKRPRAWHVVERLPRTATGKLVRDQSVLSGAR